MRDPTPKTVPFPALVQRFFTEYLVMQRAMPPHRGLLPRRHHALTGLCEHASRPGPDGDASCRPHARADRRVPRAPGAGAAQLGAQPQPAPDRAAGVPEVRWTARCHGAADGRACAGHAHEALRATAARLPDAARDCWPCSGSPATAGPPGAITCCWPCSKTPVRASRRSSACGSPTCCLTARPAFTFRARGASSDPCRCGKSPHRRCVPG